MWAEIMALLLKFFYYINKRGITIKATGKEKGRFNAQVR
jgi:hypothetical protein